MCVCERERERERETEAFGEDQSAEESCHRLVDSPLQPVHGSMVHRTVVTVQWLHTIRRGRLSFPPHRQVRVSRRSPKRQ